MSQEKEEPDLCGFWHETEAHRCDCNCPFCIIAREDFGCDDEDYPGAHQGSCY